MGVNGVQGVMGLDTVHSEVGDSVADDSVVADLGLVMMRMSSKHADTVGPEVDLEVNGGDSKKAKSVFIPR